MNLAGADVTDRLEELIKWFPSGTAEGERAILEKIFVYVREFRRILAPPPGNPYLLVGKKGTGESAIVEFSTKLLSTQGVLRFLSSHKI